MKRIEVKTFPRIHLTLISMINEGYRVNGGAGFCIENPNIVCKIRESEIFNLYDLRGNKLSENAHGRIKERIDFICHDLSLQKNISVELFGDIDSNSGFGSGTNIRLALIEGLLRINDFEFNRSYLQQISGRGGTSGIGINTYFDGGFVYDVGRKCDNDTLAPSNTFISDFHLPLKVLGLKMPDWEIGICFPKKRIRISETDESNFFRNACPIDKLSAYEISYHINFGVIPSIIESDYNTFCKSINNIQNCEWKLKEKKLYGSTIERLEKLLFKNGADAVGMSSMGPAIYFLSKDINQVIHAIRKIDSGYQIFKTKFFNQGRELKVD